MSNTIIKPGKAVGLVNSAAVPPLGVEYEKLMRDLKENTDKKYQSRTDLRQVTHLFNQEEEKPINIKMTYMLIPGLQDYNVNNNLTYKPYPQSNIPYSNGLPWSD